MTDISKRPAVQGRDGLHTDATLLKKINEAVAVANEAEKSVTMAQAELVSRSRAVGLLLLEAKKLHPAVKDFEAFLKRVDGLKLSRGYDLLRLAGGRTTDEELKKDARERQQRSREKKKVLPGPKPALKTPDSVTKPDVTESKKRPEKVPAWIDAAQQSSRALAEFTYACKSYLPRITVAADIEQAVQIVLDMTKTKPKSEAA
jgi:hypothetical protein